MLDPTMYELIRNSNQIVHNRGKALSYLGNADKKRRHGDIDGAEEVRPSKPRHEYKRKMEIHNYTNPPGFNLNATMANVLSKSSSGSKMSAFLSSAHFHK